MFHGWKFRLATPAIVAMCLIGGAAFGEPAKKDGKDLGGPNAHPPATQPGERGFGRGPGGRGQDMMRFLSELNLSDDQKTQVREIQGDFRKKLEAFQKEHGDEMKALREEGKAAREAKDREKGKAVGEKMKKLADDNGLGMKAHLDKLRNVLNDEQKAKFDEKVKSRREKGPMGPGMEGGERGERRRGEGHGPTTRPSDEKKNLDI